MANEITLAYMQEMVRRREGRMGEKQQILKLMSAVGRLADSIDDEREISAALGDVLYNTLALANTYGIDMEAADELGIRVIKASGLPAKTAPQTAAEIIYDTINNIISQKL